MGPQLLELRWLQGAYSRHVVALAHGDRKRAAERLVDDGERGHGARGLAFDHPGIPGS